MAFSNPITGGQGALIRPAIKSPNYAAGSAGWTINRDGSAEFNNLTIRGTFNGTDYVINTHGAFFYSGTPAAGNLIASISNTAGTDAFGNDYLDGFTSYSSTDFVQINDGLIEIGAVVAGIPDQADAAKINVSFGNELSFIGAQNAGTPNAATMALIAGLTGVPKPTGTEPFLSLRASTTSTCQSLRLSGAAVKSDLSDNPYQWQFPGVGSAPAYGANWSGSTTFNGTANWGTFGYRFGIEDDVWLLGCFTAAAGAGAAILTLPAAYRPQKQWPIWIQRANGGVLTSFNAEVGASGNFNILAGSGGGIAAGNEYLVNAHFPLGNTP